MPYFDRFARKPRRLFATLGAATLAFVTVLSGATASAQRIAPSTVEPARPQESLEEPPVAQSLPRRAVQLRRSQQAPQGADQIAFTFRQLDIRGAFAMDPDRLRAAWPHRSGDVVTVEEVFRFANAVTGLYAKAGYALSFAVVPEQDIDNGVVLIEVVEGYIDSFEIVGDGVDEETAEAVGEEETTAPAPFIRIIERMARRMMRARPLRAADLERYVLLINDLPGLAISTTLTPSAASGAATLRIEILERQSVSVETSYNNFITEALDRHVAGGTVTLNRLLTGADQLRFTGWRGAVSDAYWSVSGDYSLGLGSEGTRVGVSGLHSSSDPQGDFLDALEYLGRTTTGSVFMTYPMIRRRSQNVSLTAVASFSNAEADILETALTRDRLRTLELMATYDFADATRAVSFLRLGFTRGLDIADATGNSRANANVEYTLVKLDAQRDQPLFRAFSGEIGAQLSLHGQAAIGPNALFSVAECAYGGRRFGRAYDSGILVGDRCLLGAAELRWRGRFAGGLSGDVYGFVDVGLVEQKGALEPGELRDRSAASAGAGLRLRLTDRVDGLAETSWTVKDPTGLAAFEDDVRVNASLRARF